MSAIRKEPFGELSDGRTVEIYTLRNSKGAEAKIIDYGARLVSWRVMDKNFDFVDVILGYENAATYEQDTSYMGAIAGRCANRIGGAKFTLNGKEYLLDKNDGNNHLHGGFNGFDKKIWTAEVSEKSLTLVCKSADGEGGYPGNLTARVTYSLSDNNELSIEYSSTADADTICNLTSHAYFNLDGGGSILNHQIKIFSDSYTWADSESIPDGRIFAVNNTPMDFREFHKIGERIDADFDQLQTAGGYDQNWILNDTPSEIPNLKKAACVKSDKTGLMLTVLTDMPGIQFYSGNYLDGNLQGKHGARYEKRSGFCLETQYFPNAVNKKNFPQPILKKNDIRHSLTVFKLHKNKTNCGYVRSFARNG